MGMSASILFGTSGLAVAAVVSLILTCGRPALATTTILRVQSFATATLLLQIGHFAEELFTHFYLEFPQLIGLTSWPLTFFVSFNAAWAVIWLLAILWLPFQRRVALFPLWFLGIAAVANGVVHPVLALAAADYFPGLWTSPLVGCAGYLLVRELLTATSRHPEMPDPGATGKGRRTEVTR